jgi:hypothetical protein
MRPPYPQQACLLLLGRPCKKQLVLRLRVQGLVQVLVQELVQMQQLVQMQVQELFQAYLQFPPTLLPPQRWVPASSSWVPQTHGSIVSAAALVCCGRLSLVHARPSLLAQALMRVAPFPLHQPLA